MSPIFVARDTSLAVSLDDYPGTDGTITAAERTAGFALSGDLGLAGAGAMVQLDFNGVSVTTVVASDQMATAGEWSFTVPGDAAYITAPGTALTISVAVSVAGTTTSTSETVNAPAFAVPVGIQNDPLAIGPTLRDGGFFIEGNLGAPFSGATVVLSFNGTPQITVTARTTGRVGRYFVGVPARASYIPSTGSDPLTIVASVSVAGMTATGSLTVATDFVPPPTLTYAIPTVLTAGVSIGVLDSTPAFPSGVNVALGADPAPGVPPGVEFDVNTNQFKGTPTTFTDAPITYIITLTDAAGNRAVSRIVFPPVVRQTQDLSGFSYSAATVTFPNGATATSPPGAQTGLSYATDDDGTVCTVTSGNGEVTAVGPGICRVTVTATQTTVYATATATAEVEIVLGDLAGSDALAVSTRSPTGYINRLGYNSGLTVSGMFGMEDAARVVLTFDGGRAEETTTASDGTWSITVASGVAHTYIGTISEGDPLTLQAVATKAGFTAATVSATVTVDRENPEATYTIPALTAGVSVSYDPPQSDDIGTRQFLASPPADLNFDPATGRISGTPREFTAAPVTVAVTLFDLAGNQREVRIVFPPVVRQTQDLSGFSYSAATVTFPNGATATPPPGAQTGLSYATDDDGTVCTVDSGTGAVTAAGTGTCRVTVTATQTSVYASATAEAEVEIRSAGDLAGSDALAVSSDTSTAGYINRIGYDAGLTVSGMFAMEDGAGVALTFDRGNVGNAARTRTTTTAADGSWSVTLTTGDAYRYIGTLSEGALLTLQAVATKAGFVAATVDALVTVDLEDPAATYAPPTALTADVDIADIVPTSPSSDIASRTISGQPTGLFINTGNGRITGAPAAFSASTAAATVTLTDVAGNKGTTEIVFPAVARNTQVLGQFSYTPANVTVGQTAVATAPTRPSTTSLEYTTADAEVCTVNLGTGAVTPVDVGDCRVTVTAPQGSAYEAATATVTVVVRSAGDLAGVDMLIVESGGNTDGYINRAEYTAGLMMRGMFSGSNAGAATVRLTFNGGRAVQTAAEANGSWSVALASGDTGAKGTAYTYIGGTQIPEGGPLTLQAIATKAGYTAATVNATVKVDRVNPSATYTLPAALTAGVNVGTIDTNAESTDVTMRSISSGLPTGLRFNPANGEFSGAPVAFSASVARVTVTLTDSAGNEGETELEFPAVGRQTRVLSGFAYSAATVKIPNGATATAPMVTPALQSGSLRYTTTNTGVCSVDSVSGDMTPVDAGTCTVTVTAMQTSVYALATLTAAVVVEAGDGLVGLNALVVSSDGNSDAYINKDEYATGGITVSGRFGQNAATVVLTFDGGRQERADTAAGGAWAVTVTTGSDAYTHIGTLSEGSRLALRAVATKATFAPATVDMVVTVDLDDPDVTYPPAPALQETSDARHEPSALDAAGNFTATSLPAGLSIDSDTGVISGTVSASATTDDITVTVLYEDAAGNEGSTEIVYAGIAPAPVDLGGISYNPSVFPAAPMLVDIDAVSNEEYASVTGDVCTVNDPATGALTAVDFGTCTIVVSHPGISGFFSPATVTVSAEIAAQGAVTVRGPLAAIKEQDVELGVSVTVSLSGGSTEVLTVSFNGAHPATVTLASGRATVAVPEAALSGSALRVSVSGPGGFDYSRIAVFALELGLTPEELAEISETVLSEVGGIAAIQAIDVIGERLGATAANSASQGFSLQVGAARLESTRLEEERAGQMAGWAELASQEDFDREMLGRSSFSLSSGGERAAWTLWGKGAYREYERDEGGVETDGDVLSGFVGLDFDRGRLRHGLAVGRTWGDGSFSVGVEENEKGKYELDMTSGYYYLRGRTDFGSLWGILGAGTGEMRIVNGDQRSEPDLTMQMAAAGAEIDLRKGPSVDLTARAEGMVTRLESEDALVVGADRVLAGGEYGSQRLRVAIEASKEMELEGGVRVKPSADTAVRYDGGDGVEGAGIELGGGLEFSSGRLTTELHATWLAAHREDLEEWGASVSARYGLGRVVQHGLWLGAEAAGGLERGALGLDTQAGDPGAWLRDSEETDGAAGGLFSAEAGYGIGMSRLGLLTPFVGFSSDSSSRRTFSQGLRLRLNGGRVDAELAGTQSHGGGDDDDYSYGIEIKAHF